MPWCVFLWWCVLLWIICTESWHRVLYSFGTNLSILYSEQCLPLSHINTHNLFYFIFYVSLILKYFPVRRTRINIQNAGSKKIKCTYIMLLYWIIVTNKCILWFYRETPKFNQVKPNVSLLFIINKCICIAYGLVVFYLCFNKIKCV